MATLAGWVGVFSQIDGLIDGAISDNLRCVTSLVMSQLWVGGCLQ